MKEDIDEQLDEDDPLYDKVPSDEDYASVASESSSFESKKKPNFGDLNKPLAINLSSPVHMSDQTKSSRSNKATPSPSNSKLKVLTTNFDRPPANFSSNGQPASSLVANAESTLNSIMNSLNQIDYSHLNQADQSSPHEHRQADPYSRERLNHINLNEAPYKTSYTELKEENSLMQEMVSFYFYKTLFDEINFNILKKKIGRLMEENAQLRAEKMITTTNVTNNISQNINNFYPSEQMGLYSTVKNKKFNLLKDHLVLNSHGNQPKLHYKDDSTSRSNEHEYYMEAKGSPTHHHMYSQHAHQPPQFKKHNLTIELSDSSSNEFKKNSNYSSNSDNLFDQ